MLVATLLAGLCFAGSQAHGEELGGAPPQDAQREATPSPLASSSGERRQRFVPGQLLVGYSADERSSTMARVREAVGARPLAQLPQPGLELVELRPGDGVVESARRLEREPGVRYAEPNYLDRIQAVPDDPRLAEQWALENTGQEIEGRTGVAGADIGALEAWDVSTGSADVTVAVIDTGIDRTHPDLAPNQWMNPGESGRGESDNGVDDDRNGFVDDIRGWDFSGGSLKRPRPGDRDPADDFGHGSHIAGIIGGAGNNGEGIAGINWDVSLMALKVNYGPVVPRSLSIQAIDYADRMGADVINLSIGGRHRSRAFADAIASAKDILVVTPAGNSRDDVEEKPFFPCAYRGSGNNVCVAATDNRDRLAGFSSFGAKHVDLAAPGDNTMSTQVKGGYGGGGPVVFLEALLDNGFTRPDPLGDDAYGGRWETGGEPNDWALALGHNELGDTIVDSPAGPYPNGADTWVSSPAVDLRKFRNCEFSVMLGTTRTEEGRDFLIVEAAAEGEPWVTLERFTGRFGYKAPRFRELEAIERKPNVRFRFRLTSDAAGVDEGVSIDDAYLACSSLERYDFQSGTSFAVPHVAGAAALLLADEPRLRPKDLRRRILASADPLAALEGKVKTGGRLDLAGALGE